MIAQAAGLRERKKRQTENAIEEAAVSLALELGYATVTVTQICERADVSRSTFFNYMPTREAAIFGPPLHMISSQEALPLLGDDAPHANTTALFGVLLASLPHASLNPTVAIGRARLLAEQPETQTILFTQFGPLSTQLTALAVHWFDLVPQRRRLPGSSAAREASLTVGLVMAGFLAVIGEATGTGDVTITIAAFEKAVADMAHIAAL